jgi:ferredoxin
MKEFRYLKNVTTLELRPEGCVGCGRCVEVCPHQVFELAGKRVRIVDRDACMECGACARNCPFSVIEVDAGVGCAAGLIREWFRERNGKGVAGACCS